MVLEFKPSRRREDTNRVSGDPLVHFSGYWRSFRDPRARTLKKPLDNYLASEEIS
jgi:hypothetical protein